MNDEIRKLWEEFTEEYKEYLKSNEEIWKDNLDKLKQYINENNIRPSYSSNNNEIKRLGNWIQTQQTNYKKDTMNDEIRKLWEEFIKEYNEYFK
jgi:predicted phage gp36 major capsid-like protein